METTGFAVVNYLKPNVFFLLLIIKPDFMKLFLIALTLFCGIVLKAENAQSFLIDDAILTSKFQNLDQLENYVNQHKGVTLTQLKASQNELVNQISSDNSFALSGTPGTGELPIPPFFIGLLLPVIGIGIVFFTTQDGDDTVRAIYGTVVTLTILALIWSMTYIFVSN